LTNRLGVWRIAKPGREVAFELLSFVYASEALAIVKAPKLQTGAGDQ